MAQWIQTKFNQILSTTLYGFTTSPTMISGGELYSNTRQALLVSNTSTTNYIYLGFSTVTATGQLGSPTVGPTNFDICILPLATESVACTGQVPVLAAASAGTINSKVTEVA